MKKTILLVLILLFLNGNTPAHAYSKQVGQQQENVQSSEGKFASIPSSLHKAVMAIESLPEAAKLIEEVQKEGPVGIEAQYFYDSDFEALWDSENRIIYVNILKNETLGKEISSILFELHNAKTNKNLTDLFKQAQAGLIDKDSYVECIERLEHSNALSTSKLIEKGIAMSLFPEDARWDIFDNFDDHYKVQQIYGHSQWIADRFDSLCPAPRRKSYNGTIKGLSKMSNHERDRIVRLLVLKNQTRSENPLIAQKAYQKIQEELENKPQYDADHAIDGMNKSANNNLFQAVFSKSKNCTKSS